MSVPALTYEDFLRRKAIECYSIADKLGGQTYPKNPARVFVKALLSGTLPVAVILGQDPYPQEGVATGIAFANHKREGMYKDVPLSPSLQVIKNSVQKAYPGEFDETLVSWVNQGILPLNSAFTVMKDSPGSNSMEWVPFTSKLLRDLSEMFPCLYYIMLGKTASFFAGHIMDGCVVHEMHPSYYARTGKEFPTTVWKDLVSYVKQTFDKQLHLTNEQDT